MGRPTTSRGLSSGLPLFAGGGSRSPSGPYLLPVARLTRGRSPSPTRRAGGGRPGGSSGMRLLRLLVMCGVSLLAVLLLYVQFTAAARAFPPIDGTDSNSAQPSEAADSIPSAQQQQQQQQQQPPAAPPEGFPAPELTHLVLVAGHAVYTGLDFSVAGRESSWFLEPYQQVEGEAQSFLDHIRLGIQAAAADPAALLMFSGGQTRRAAGPRSEGLSYWMVAEAAGWWGHAAAVRARAYTEEHARDSFENLLFSLCRFYEITGHAPSKVTAVSYSLKQRRFEEVHRAALRFPAAAFRFIGTPVPPAAKGAVAGEEATVAAFLRDPYGCAGRLLAKKARRDPFAVGAPHSSRCPAIAGLLRYCGARVYAGALPWDPGPAAAGAGGKQLQAGLLAAKGRRSSRAGIYT